MSIQEYLNIYIESIDTEVQNNGITSYMYTKYNDSNSSISDSIPAIIQGIDYNYFLKKTELSNGLIQNTGVYYRLQGTDLICIELSWVADSGYITMMKGFDE